MTVVAADYAWFNRRPAGLAGSYCFTMVEKLSEAEVLSRLGAAPERVLTGVEALIDASIEVWRKYHGAQLLIGVTTAHGDDSEWALGVEFNGYIGVSESHIRRLSAGSRLVSHARSIEFPSRFYMLEDGNTRLSFEPLFAGERSGRDPDGLTEIMRQVGFTVDSERRTKEPVLAALALADVLTGVRLTPQFLEKATYTCGLVRGP